MPLWKTLGWVGLVVWSGVLFVTSATPSDDLGWASFLPDYIWHGGAYALHGALARLALWRPGERLLSPRLFWAVLLSSLYGLSDEVHQSFIPGRDASVVDWTVDTIGAAAGGLFAVFLASWLQQKVSQVNQGCANRAGEQQQEPQDV